MIISREILSLEGRSWEIRLPSPPCLLILNKKKKFNGCINGHSINGIGMGAPLLQKVHQIKLLCVSLCGAGLHTVDCQEGLFRK